MMASGLLSCNFILGCDPLPKFVPLAHSYPFRSRISIQHSCRSSNHQNNLAIFAMAQAKGDSSSAAVTSFANESSFGVLFVCLGNICRSPSAEAVFTYAVERRGWTQYFRIDSAGTIDYHEGNPADPRMRAAALKRGIKVTSISRPIKASDFEEFDLILAMDKQNKKDILKAYNIWNLRKPFALDVQSKVQLMCSYCRKYKDIQEVPDPYYGGPAGFEKVLDLLEDACEGLLDSIISNAPNKVTNKQP